MKWDLESILLHTTRPMRTAEKNGVEYYFVCPEILDKMERKKELIERRDYKTVAGIWSYATSKKSIDLNCNNYIIPSTWEMYQNFLKVYKTESLIPIYIEVPDDIRMIRCIDRERKEPNPNYSELIRRLYMDSLAYSKELLEKYQPFMIHNDDSLEKTCTEIESILTRKLKIMPNKNSYEI